MMQPSPESALEMIQTKLILELLMHLLTTPPRLAARITSFTEAGVNPV
jgi:hypothetical protein